MDFNSEMDRVVGERQARVDQLTTRSGVLTAIATLATSIISTQIRAQQVPNLIGVILLTVSVVVGVIVLCGRRIVTGPRPPGACQLAAAARRRHARVLGEGAG